MVALFDFLKRKKEVEKAKKPVEKKTEKVLVAKEAGKKEEKIPASAKISGAAKKGFSYTVIQEPHISEKATDLAEGNKYTFKVYAQTRKPEIKKSVEGIYGVDVLDVNIIKIPGKKRRLGRTEGFKRGHVKAIVTIKEGQKIEII